MIYFYWIPMVICWIFIPIFIVLQERATFDMDMIEELKMGVKNFHLISAFVFSIVPVLNFVCAVLLFIMYFGVFVVYYFKKVSMIDFMNETPFYKGNER